MNERPLDHVGIVVPSIRDASTVWARLTGAPVGPVEVVESQGVEVAFCGTVPGRVELIAPVRPDSPVARFLERRGPGLHHLCYRVPDIVAALAEHTAQGFRPIDRQPRIGAGGHLVAFLEPKSASGVLIELLEAPDH